MLRTTAYTMLGFMFIAACATLIFVVDAFASTLFPNMHNELYGREIGLGEHFVVGFGLLIILLLTIISATAILTLSYGLGKMLHLTLNSGINKLSNVTGSFFCTRSLHNMQYDSFTEHARSTGWAGHVIRVEKKRCTREDCWVSTKVVV